MISVRTFIPQMTGYLMPVPMRPDLWIAVTGMALVDESSVQAGIAG